MSTRIRFNYWNDVKCRDKQEGHMINVLDFWDMMLVQPKTFAQHRFGRILMHRRLLKWAHFRQIHSTNLPRDRNEYDDRLDQRGDRMLTGNV
jgi:hypothetical protein